MCMSREMGMWRVKKAKDESGSSDSLTATPPTMAHLSRYLWGDMNWMSAPTQKYGIWRRCKGSMCRVSVGVPECQWWGHWLSWPIMAATQTLHHTHYLFTSYSNYTLSPSTCISIDSADIQDTKNHLLTGMLIRDLIKTVLKHLIEVHRLVLSSSHLGSNWKHSLTFVLLHINSTWFSCIAPNMFASCWISLCSNTKIKYLEG